MNHKPALIRPKISLLCWPLALCFSLTAYAQEIDSVLPAPVVTETTSSHHETIVLSGGCFWGVQGVFQHVRGVSRALSGYTGGSARTAQYETVSTGDTGHAESVMIDFDPQQISVGELLRIYFSVAHDPTELNYQGPDTGTQYRSAIWVTSSEQTKVAQAYIDQLTHAKIFHQPIVTTVQALTGFYPAEHYHQDYLTLHPDNPYISINDLPKVNQLKRLYPADYRDKPILVEQMP